MRAVVCHLFGDYRSLKTEDIAPPALPPGSVRIAVELAAVGYAMRLWIAGQYQRKPPLPFVPGTEVIGTVLEVAPGVISVRPGQRVLGVLDWGGWAEQCVASEFNVYPVPDGLDSGAALHLGVSYGTAYGALHWRAGLKAGETLLVLAAAGGVGLGAVELGTLHGARVIAAASSADKCALAAEHGAAATIDYSHQQIRDAGRTDVVFDPVGGELAEQASRTLVPGGRHLVIGFASGKVPELPANILLVKNVSVLGFNFGTYLGWSPADERERHAPRVREVYSRLFAWAAEGRLRPHLSQSYALEQVVEAMDCVQSRLSTGKVALRVGPGRS